MSSQTNAPSIAGRLFRRTAVTVDLVVLDREKIGAYPYRRHIIAGFRK